MPSASRKRRNRGRLWNVSNADAASIRHLEAEAGLSPLLARTLASRGLATAGAARSFLDARLTDFLGDPLGVKDMERAANRIARAIAKPEQIAIFGDYDVDGITATVLMLRVLRWLGAEPIYYIPHRTEEGYGLSCEAIDSLASKGVRLLITVDNGITSLEEVDHAQSHGLDCIVTDHHQAGPQLPNAFAVVNPNRPDCTYGFRHLSGVGVAFKLAHALLRCMGVEERRAKSFLTSLLDLVAVGTVADIVPLVGENRALVRAGLARFEQTENVGLSALLSLCERRWPPFQAETITYFLAPRLNAPGRTEHASLSVDLLTTTDNNRAIDLAHQLDQLNDRRRAIERRIFDEGLALVRQQCDMANDLVYVVIGHDWHLGVVGIVASKMTEHFHKPIIVLSESDGLARGSARTTAGFDIHAALGRCSDFLRTFGGHRQAAGLSLQADSVELLRERLNSFAAEMMGEEEIVEHLDIDAICEPDDLSLDAVADLQALEPCGCGNPKPVFVLLGADPLGDPRIVGANHLKMTVACGHQDFDVIGFSMGDSLAELRQIAGPIDIAFQPVISEWGGSPRVELQLCDFRPSAS